MFRWAVIFLVLSLVVGALGLTNISAAAKRISMVLFALFFLGFLAFLGFVYLVGSAATSSEFLPMLTTALA